MADEIKRDTQAFMDSVVDEFVGGFEATMVKNALAGVIARQSDGDLKVKMQAIKARLDALVGKYA